MFLYITWMLANLNVSGNVDSTLWQPNIPNRQRANTRKFPELYLCTQYIFPAYWSQIVDESILNQIFIFVFP